MQNNSFRVSYDKVSYVNISDLAFEPQDGNTTQKRWFGGRKGPSSLPTAGRAGALGRKGGDKSLPGLGLLGFLLARLYTP